MKKRYVNFNSKRRLLSPAEVERRVEELDALASQVRYGGNPEHKMNPGDFGLTPPADPRQGKSLCDVANVSTREKALQLLRDGLRKGLVSDRLIGQWPRNVWSVTDGGIAMEAQLENPESGTYHGYPMPDSDPLSESVVERWEKANG